MENLKRYGPCISEHGFATMQKIDNGGWVKFSDIKELLQTDAQRLKAEIAAICDEHDDALSQHLIGNDCSDLFNRLRQLSAV
jgi:hypothetical protein